MCANVTRMLEVTRERCSPCSLGYFAIISDACSNCTYTEELVTIITWNLRAHAQCF
jgi:hypothetical protein